MKPVQTWILMAVTTLGLTQCNTTSNGDDPTPDPNISKTELLAGKSSKAWILTSSKVNGDELINQALPCSRDDNMVFRADKTYEGNEGASKCNANDPQVYDTGTWEFSTGETEIILNKELRYTIVKLAANTLQISIKNVFGETEELTFKPN
jgi:Lipocalin-like domain